MIAHRRQHRITFVLAGIYNMLWVCMQLTIRSGCSDSRGCRDLHGPSATSQSAGNWRAEDPCRPSTQRKGINTAARSPL